MYIYTFVCICVHTVTFTCMCVYVYIYIYAYVCIWQFFICHVLKNYERITKHTNFVWTTPPLGPCGSGPYGPPWALVGRALMGRDLVDPPVILRAGPLWAVLLWSPLGRYGPCPSGPPWAPMGRAFMGRALVAAPGPYGLGPCGLGPYEPPGPSWVHIEFDYIHFQGWCASWTLVHQTDEKLHVYIHIYT